MDYYVTTANEDGGQVGTNITYGTKEPYIRPFDHTGIVTSGVIIFTFLFGGILFNLLTILVIWTYSRLRNLFMYFIFSLCVSDLISAVISPLFWYRRTLGFDTWALPDFFCKFYWAADLATSFATAVHIMSFALMRYISIRFPVFFSKFTRRSILIWIACIWIASITFGFIPFAIFFGARKRDRYSDSPDARWPACTINMEWYGNYTLYQKIAYPIFLYIPVIGVVIISILIIYTVLGNSKVKDSVSKSAAAEEKRRQKEKQAVAQLSLIVFSFLLGYIPFTAYEFWSVQSRPNTLYYKKFDYWFGMTEYFVLRFSECLNPIFYNLGSNKMRKYTKKYLTEDICCGRKGNRQHGPSSSSVTTGV